MAFKGAFLWAWALVLGCGACAKYGILISDEPATSALVLVVPENFEIAREKLVSYLRWRQRFDSEFRPISDFQEARFNQPWVRDSSLRYQSLRFDRRQRHLVEWKGQWVLRRVTPSACELRLNILEILYLGEPHAAGTHAELNGDWFETSVDGLRAALELRRYWLEVYPSEPMPQALLTLKVSPLEGPPGVRSQFRTSWKRLLRHRAF